MPSRPHRAILVAFALLSAAALAASCSKKDSTSPGPTFSFTFPQTGTSNKLVFTDVGSWGYHCIPHGASGMTGTVVVNASSANDSVVVQVGPSNSLSFSPNSVSIKPGGYVRWVNASTLNFNHTVTRP